MPELVTHEKLIKIAPGYFIVAGQIDCFGYEQVDGIPMAVVCTKGGKSIQLNAGSKEQADAIVQSIASVYPDKAVMPYLKEAEECQLESENSSKS